MKDLQESVKVLCHHGKAVEVLDHHVEYVEILYHQVKSVEVLRQVAIITIIQTISSVNSNVSARKTFAVF